MKKFIWILLFVPFATFGAECPTPDDCYTDRLIFEIVDSEGKVVDRTSYERLVGMSYSEVMTLKYVRMRTLIQNATSSFIEILSGGDVKKVLTEK